jgi:hypothetical protein
MRTGDKTVYRGASLNIIEIATQRSIRETGYVLHDGIRD